MQKTKPDSPTVRGLRGSVTLRKAFCWHSFSLLVTSERRLTVNQYKFVQSVHLYTLIKHLCPDGSGSFLDDNAVICMLRRKWCNHVLQSLYSQDQLRRCNTCSSAHQMREYLLECSAPSLLWSLTEQGSPHLYDGFPSNFPPVCRRL